MYAIQQRQDSTFPNWYLADKAGWGPTFTSSVAEAKKFDNKDDAKDYNSKMIHIFNTKVVEV